jgi:ribonuclease P protein component
MRLNRRMGQCWPKTFRLRKRREYLLVQRRARKHLTQDLVILWMAGRTSTTRLGITVSRKVAKQAVLRNRVKRWIRESFRRLDLDLASRPLDVAVIARPRAVRANYQTIRSQITSFWDRVEPADNSPSGR